MSGLALLSAVARALTICPACGYEAEDGVARCGHCGAAIPGAAAPAAPAAAVPVAPPAPGKGTPDPAAAMDAAREDVLWARDMEKASQPAAALRGYENALALLALAQGDPRAAAGGAQVAEAILRCRDAVAVGSRVCSVCNGSGKRTYSAHVMGGDDVVREVGGSVCAACGGRGRVRARRNQSEISALVNKAARDFAILRQGDGRIASGNAWIPAAWELSVEETAILRRAIPDACSGCAGFHQVECHACKGDGVTPCRAKGCKQGFVEKKNANTLTPKTGLVLQAPCPVCQGAASVPCATCKGAGRVPCPKCDGAGLAPVCRSCSGEGLVPCKSCRGAGSDRRTGAPCAACGGEGRQLCTACQGDGRSER